MIQDATEKQVLTTEFNIAHLVSTKWFDKWKRYTNFNHILHKSKESYNGNNANDSDIRLLKEDQESVHPGPINSDDILDLESKFLQDPDKVKEYCNSIVKQGLVENIDFIILPHNVWKYLHKIYSGKDIKRYVISVNDETNQTSIEIWLKKINVLVCPPINKNQSYQECEVQTLYISKKEAVKDLKEKVTRTLQSQGDIHNNVNMSSCRLWKLDPKEDYSQFVRYVAEEGKENEAIPIKGKKLPDGQVLEVIQRYFRLITLCFRMLN